MEIKDILNLFESVQLDESFKDAKEAFLNQGIDETEIDQVISQFKKLSSENKLYGRKKDIGAWMSSPFLDLKDYVEQQANTESKRQKVRNQKKDRIIAYKDDKVTVVIPLSKEASIFYGKNTKWCTSATDYVNQFDDYFYTNNGTIFYIIAKNKKFAVTAYNSNDGGRYHIMDDTDTPSNSEEMYKRTGIDLENIKKLYKKFYRDVLGTKREYLTKKYDTEKKQITHIKYDDVYDTLKNITDLGIRLYDNSLLAALKENNGVEYIASLGITIPPNLYKSIALLKNGIDIMRYLKLNISEELQLLIVKKNGMSIGKLISIGIKPSKDVQLAAVLEDNNAIYYIMDADIDIDDEVKKAAGL